MTVESAPSAAKKGRATANNVVMVWCSLIESLVVKRTK